MENIITRFQHIAEKIFDQLDNRSLVNCREVTSSWQKFIDCKNLPWIQIVNIPKILKKKDTYWHVASKTGQIIILDMIFEIEQDFDINTQDEQGRTVFHCACMNGHTKIAQRLIQNSVLVNLDLNLKSWNGWTALHLSCASGQSKIVNILIKNSEQFNIELNAKNHYEMTGFHLACDYGHLDIVDLLMKKSTELNIELNAKDHCDGTGFHLACGRGWLRIVQKLLEKSEEVSIDLNDKDINGWTGFHMACAGGRVDIVDMMIENAFKGSFKIDLSVKDNHNRNGFHLAKENRKTDVVNLIESKLPVLAFPLPNASTRKDVFDSELRSHGPRKYFDDNDKDDEDSNFHRKAVKNYSK